MTTSPSFGEQSAVPIPSLGTRRIFVSHAHADRHLTQQFGSLITKAFSGLVTPYFSSDPSPSGGITPGDQWYQRIHAELSASEAVWVLATTASIGRPWLYWEAGIGRAVCPHGIVIVRVKLGAEAVPSPLNAYQSYDALRIEDSGLTDLLTKVGHQIGMNIDREWIDKCAADFIASAQRYEPELQPVAGVPPLSPEHTNQLDGLIARLEFALARVGPTSTHDPVRHDYLEISSNSPFQDGFNAVVVRGSAVVSRVADQIARQSGRVVQALLVLSGGTWLYYVPSAPDINGGLAQFPGPVASAIAILGDAVPTDIEQFLASVLQQARMYQAEQNPPTGTGGA